MLICYHIISTPPFFFFWCVCEFILSSFISYSIIQVKYYCRMMSIAIALAWGVSHPFVKNKKKKRIVASTKNPQKKVIFLFVFLNYFLMDFCRHRVGLSLCMFFESSSSSNLPNFLLYLLSFLFFFFFFGETRFRRQQITLRQYCLSVQPKEEGIPRKKKLFCFFILFYLGRAPHVGSDGEGPGSLFPPTVKKHSNWNEMEKCL